MKRLRIWLIEKLAGKMSIGVNLALGQVGAIEHSPHGGALINCTIDHRPDPEAVARLKAMLDRHADSTYGPKWGG